MTNPLLARMKLHYRAVRERLQRAFQPRLGQLVQHPPRPLSMRKNYGLLSPPEPAPSISIVTPSYNQAPYLARTMASILDQGYPNLQYIVQDGGSTDGSVEVLKGFDGRLHRWESQRDRGQAHAINLGLAHATGDILAYLNSDDLLLPGSLAYVARYFANHPDVDALYSHRVIIDTNDLEIGRWILPPHDDEILGWMDFVPQETLFWRRRLWNKIGGQVDESFQFALDWDMLVRFRDAGARMVRVPRFLGAFRVHPEQKTNARLIEVGKREVKRIRERVHGRPVTRAEVRQRTRDYHARHVMYDSLYRLGLLAG